MDPKQALLDALTALSNGDLREANELMDGYWEWIGKGGFDPQNIRGADFAKAIEIALMRKRTGSL